MKVYDKCTVPVRCLLFFFFFSARHCILRAVCACGAGRERERELLCCMCARPSVTVDFEEFVHASDQMSRDVASVFKLRPVVLL